MIKRKRKSKVLRQLYPVLTGMRPYQAASVRAAVRQFIFGIDWNSIAVRTSVPARLLVRADFSALELRAVAAFTKGV